MLKATLISLAITLASTLVFSVFSTVVHLWGRNQVQLGSGALLAYTVLTPEFWIVAVAAFFLTFWFLTRTVAQ